VDPGPIPGDEILRPRSRDLLRALAATHRGNEERSRMLLEFFKSGQAVAQEPLSPEQDAVLSALYSYIHKRKEFGSVQTRDLTEMVNIYLERAGERLRLQPRKVGAVLTSLGFTDRCRTKSGWVVWVNREDAEKLHELADNYGIDKLDERSLKFSPDECELCEALAARKANRAPRFPKGATPTNTYERV
jgi:hypothetical protein